MGDKDTNPFGEEPSHHLLGHGAANQEDGYGGNASANNAFGNQQDLQFQNFQHTTINIDNQRPMGSAIMQADTSEDYAQPGAAPAPQEPAKRYNFWNLQYYAYLFNVDTQQVVNRIVRSMMPFRFSFMDTIQANPDCYGPFWISTTLIFILAAAGNLDSYLKSADDYTWTYNFNLVTVGAIAIYVYVFLLPIVLWGVLKYLSVPAKMLDVICIYGYSLFIYIPISIVCIVSNDILQWVFTFFACGLSGWFLMSNVFVPIKNASHPKKGMIIVLVLAVLHVGLALLYKLYFFRLVTSDSSSSSDPTAAPTHSPAPTTTMAPTTTTTTLAPTTTLEPSF